jgi:hypothetical protein
MISTEKRERERESYKKGVRKEIDRASERDRMHKHYRARD